MNMLQRLKHICSKTGCERYEIVRQRNHMVVDFITERGTKVRATLAKTTSDDARALQNQIAVVRRLLKEKGF